MKYEKTDAHDLEVFIISSFLKRRRYKESNQVARPVFLVLVYICRLNSPARLLNVFPELFTPSPTCAGDRKVPGLCTTHCLVF